MAVPSELVRVRHVRALDDPDARDPELAGSKAASLADAAHHGLPVIPGFVVATGVHDAYLAGGRELTPELTQPLHEAWTSFTEEGRIPVVVRSSSTVEDIAASSMAGRFRSVLDVRDWAGFLEAVRAVYASADDVAEGSPPSPMGVLVQEYLVPSRSGVMFGVDPVTGNAGRIVVEAVSGGPDKLVSGEVSAQRYVLTRRGRLVTLDHKAALHLSAFEHRRRLLGPRDMLGLAALARRTERYFGSPQDVEWAITEHGHLRLLQSRPVTATAPGPGRGPVLGPGPLGETFPDPLAELEVDLWVGPLHAGAVDALTETGAAPPARIDPSPVVTTVHGRVAVDLELIGYVSAHSPLGFLDPRPAVRQLRVAWRTGSLRGELPSRVGTLVAETDHWLTTLRPRAETDQGLLRLLDEAVERLRRLHHDEVLAGTLLPPAPATAAGMALRVLASADRRLPADELVRRHPVLLSLIPPSLGAPLVLPPAVPGPEQPLPPLGEREQLRLRARWVQELTVRVAHELSRRLVERGALEHHDDIAFVHLAELEGLLGASEPLDVIAERRAQAVANGFLPPLPAEFRFTDDHQVVPVARPRGSPGFGTPAGGGRGLGPVCHGSARRPPAPGDVLVVRTLEPGLAGWLPELAGLVAETGASLSHLAILAREYGIPTVVGVRDALQRFPPGARLLVDGRTGEVRAADGRAEP